MNEEKIRELDELKHVMFNDTQLPLQPANLVFGEGSPDAEVLFIGEAPGAEEDRLIRPFVGRAGKLLRQCIRELGWREEDVYITNIVKRRPPGNRDPEPDEIDFYRPYLKRQIQIIDPKVIVTLGRFAMNYFLPDGRITRDQGKLFIIKDKIIYPVFHPAAALRGTQAMTAFKRTLTQLPKVVTEGKALRDKSS